MHSASRIKGKYSEARIQGCGHLIPVKLCRVLPLNPWKSGAICTLHSRVIYVPTVGVVSMRKRSARTASCIRISTECDLVRVGTSAKSFPMLASTCVCRISVRGELCGAMMEGSLRAERRKEERRVPSLTPGVRSTKRVGAT